MNKMLNKPQGNISMFHRVFFYSIIDEYQHTHFFTFNAPQGSSRTPTACIAATTPRLIIRILNSVFLKTFKNFNYSVILTRYRPTP